MKRNYRNILSCIYKATDCADISDCEIAIDKIYSLFSNEEIKAVLSINKRLNSLIVKKNKFL